MLAIDPLNITARENYKFLTGSIIPRPIAFVTTLSRSGVLNGAPFSFFNVVASDPPMIAVSVQRKDGQLKDTSRNAIDQKEFVVHITDDSYLEKMNITAASLPEDQSEVDLAELTQVESFKIKTPGIKDAKIRMECQLEKALSLGGNSEPNCELLIGSVVQYHIQEEIYDQANGHIDPEKLKPVSRLAGNDYALLGDIIELIRPK